ncbi:unnamed protein product, partial [Schistosoma haematobium]
MLLYCLVDRTIRSKVRGVTPLRKPSASVCAPEPHTNRMIYVAYVYLVPPCINVYVFTEINKFNA